MENTESGKTWLDGSYLCPCCGYPTLHERSSFETCPVCMWEDDGQDEHNTDEVTGGPNGGVTLTEARQAFAASKKELLANDEAIADFVAAVTEADALQTAAALEKVSRLRTALCARGT